MVQCTSFALNVTDIHIGFEQACSIKRKTSTWFCRSQVWRDSAFNALRLWSLREARCQQIVVGWLRSVCGTERRRNWLWRKKTLPLQGLGFSDTLEQCKGLLSVPCYCLSWGLGTPYSAAGLEVHFSCDQMQIFSTWDWTDTPHAVQDADKSLLWQCAALLQQESALIKKCSVSDQLVFFHTTL